MPWFEIAICIFAIIATHLALNWGTEYKEQSSYIYVDPIYYLIGIVGITSLAMFALDRREASDHQLSLKKAALELSSLQHWTQERIFVDTVVDFYTAALSDIKFGLEHCGKNDYRVFCANWRSLLPIGRKNGLAVPQPKDVLASLNGASRQHVEACNFARDLHSALPSELNKLKALLAERQRFDTPEGFASLSSSRESLRDYLRVSGFELISYLMGHERNLPRNLSLLTYDRLSRFLIVCQSQGYRDYETYRLKKLLALKQIIKGSPGPDEQVRINLDWPLVSLAAAKMANMFAYFWPFLIIVALSMKLAKSVASLPGGKASLFRFLYSANERVWMYTFAFITMALIFGMLTAPILILLWWMGAI